MKLLRCEKEAYLHTRELTEQERSTLDYLSGYELIEKEMRLFVVEGRQESMRLFYSQNERTKPNDRTFKMLYNPDIRYH